MFFKLAIKSLLNRKGSVLLAVLSISVSIFVLLGVEHVRQQARESFSNSVSGVDLIVGARTGKLNLLLYSVFHLGSPTNNIRWQSFQTLANNPRVKWAVPISLGDSHKGYRVVGTSSDYFQHFSYGRQQPLVFSQGKAFAGMFDVVLGAEVASKLGYKLGDKVVLAHGVAKTSFSVHDDRPFTVVGVLAPTATPVDQSLFVSLSGIEAIHVDWQNGVKLPHSSVTTEQLAQLQLEPKSITAMMLGLTSKMATFRVQREINEFTDDPLTAILPGAALSQLWQLMGVFENTLRLVSLLVLISSLLGLSAMLLASIRERSLEILLLRSIGASPLFLFMLIELEALFVCLLSIVLGSGSLYLLLLLFKSHLVAHFGLSISMQILSGSSLSILGAVIALSILAAGVPAVSSYKVASRCHV